MSTVTRILVLAAAAASLILLGAAPAWASHTVQWGIDRPDGSRTASVDASQPISFAVSATLDGEPLAGWPMSARVLAAGEVVQTIELATDGTGHGEFVVEGVPAGEEWNVELCDDDGCAYGTATISGTAASAPPIEAPSTTTTAAIPVTTAAAETAAAAGPASDDSGVPWVLVIVVLVAALLSALAIRTIRNRRTG